MTRPLNPPGWDCDPGPLVEVSGIEVKPEQPVRTVEAKKQESEKTEIETEILRKWYMGAPRYYATVERVLMLRDAPRSYSKCMDETNSLIQ
jgi:hypothetical protein